MKALQKYGGIAALYMAAAYLMGMVIFLVVLDYPGITSPAEKVTLLVEQSTVIFITNLLIYVFFGVILIIFCLALYERMKSGAPYLMQVATVIGIIWAGSLIASGMVSNAGIEPTLVIFAQDPGQAAIIWQGYETVANGLGNGNGEILGGILTLLISIAGIRTKVLPKALHILGIVIGGIGILSIIPVLTDLTGLFGVGQAIWFVWLGINLIRNR